MELIELKTSKEFTLSNLNCKLLITKIITRRSGRIQHIGENHYKFITEDTFYEFMLNDMQDSKLLTSMLKQYPYNLAQIVSSSNNGSMFSLHIVFFYKSEREVKLNIVLGQKVKRLLIEKKLVRNEKQLEEDVIKNFIMTDGHNECYAYTTGSKEKFENEFNENEVDKKSDAPESQNIQADAETYQTPDTNLRKIKLFGKDYSLLICLRETDAHSYFYAEKVFIKNRNIPPLALKIGKLSFKDEESYISEKIKKELEMTSGYLDIWDKYTAVEGDFILKKARSIGVISIDRKNITRDQNGLMVYPQNLTPEQKALISEGDFLLVSDEIPNYIEDEEMTWEEYKKVLFAPKTIESPKKKAKLFKIKRIDKSGNWIIEATGYETLPDGFVSYSIHGDMQQIIRRENARKLIENGESALPSLGLVIEGKKSDALIQVTQSKAIEPISAHVKEKIFAYEPREAQREAIRIALNTPDIAIIQGPPGTGKTTVITAIIERLNEISDKRKDNRGQVLITSFQHDAVRNVIYRLSVNSLPTIKFGKQGDDDTTQDQIIEKWCAELIQRLKERNPSIQQTVEQQEFERIHNAYLASPNDENAIAFLECAKKLNYDNALNEEIETILNDIMTVEHSTESKLVEKIRRLRCTKQGFMDDGSETADDLLAELEGILDLNNESNKRIISVLEDAADSVGEVDDNILASLQKIKHELLSKCIPRPLYKIEQPRPEIISLYTRIVSSLSKPTNEEEEILFTLLNELENNSVDVEKMIASYNLVYAATAQQSEGNDIKKAKNLQKFNHPIYETVIIDEAARVNPGDLMIPMSQASRRIILVGDHRQLPHIYDEEIFENLRDNGNDVGKEVVKISMFQYLKGKAEELSKIDKIPRTITLDAQYRMHPELGDFVNANFYEPYGEGFLSPLSAEKFAQKIYDKPYMWLNLKSICGNEEKRGTSRVRECEADYIVNKLREYILSEDGKDLSYGVITFYSAQAKLIKRKLKDLDISDRVRVGSVDAFQGMEFDVIFLSVVRTHTKEPSFNHSILNIDMTGCDTESQEYKEWHDYVDEIGMRYYGFLTSENRLCVALSRQKKLLIVVGDSTIFSKGNWLTVAEKCVPALKNFYELCETRGAVIDVEA